MEKEKERKKVIESEDDTEDKDFLIFRSLVLSQDLLDKKLDLEKCNLHGFNALAQTRYSKGYSSVSIHQIPADNIEPFTFVNRENNIRFLDSLIQGPQCAKSDPKTWFGFLVPQTIKTAQKTFVRGLQLCVEIVNIQNELLSVIHKIESLVESQ